MESVGQIEINGTTFKLRASSVGFWNHVSGSISHSVWRLPSLIMAQPVAAPAAPLYLFNIKSIQDVHPTLPAVIGSVNLNDRIQANTEINPADLSQAHGTVRTLKGYKGKYYDFLKLHFSYSLAYRLASAVGD
jgi:hypothetical protein